MADFNPDEFLAGTAPRTKAPAAGFDPDAFLGAGAADRPEWLDKKSAQPPAPHSLDSLSADIARAKASLPSTGDIVRRGVEAGATGLGDVLNSGTAGAYHGLRDLIGGAVAPEATAAAQRNENEAHAELQKTPTGQLLQGTASGLGYLAGAPEAIGEASAAGIGKLTERAPAFARRLLSSRPVAGALVGGTSNAANGAAQDMANGADAGEIARNAGQNALTGAAVGGAMGAGGAALNARGRLLEKLRPGAQARAVKDISHDITAAEGPKARVTDQKRIAEVDKRLFELTKEEPGLRDTWRKPAEKALPEIEAAKRRAAAPLDGAYKAVDAATGGIRLGDIVDGFEAAAKEAGTKASGQAEAARFRAVKDNFLKAYGEPAFDPTKPVTKEGITAGQMLDMLEKAKARGAPGMDQQIAQVREMAAGGVNMDKRIPTAAFREEVTDLHKTAEAAMGGLEGTARSEALSKLYQTGKQVIDTHLDASGIPAGQLAELRKANDRYFLLSRAQAAVASRGWKESNQHTGFIAHTARQAADMSLPVAMGYAAMHPHAAPIIGATMAARALPAAASRVNWALANRAPSTPTAGTSQAQAAVSRLLQAARAGATPAQLQQQAQDDGLPPEMATQLAQGR